MAGSTKNITNFYVLIRFLYEVTEGFSFANPAGELLPKFSSSPALKRLLAPAVEKPDVIAITETWANLSYLMTEFAIVCYENQLHKKGEKPYVYSMLVRQRHAP